MNKINQLFFWIVFFCMSFALNPMEQSSSSFSSSLFSSSSPEQIGANVPHNATPRDDQKQLTGAVAAGTLPPAMTTVSQASDSSTISLAAQCHLDYVASIMDPLYATILMRAIDLEKINDLIAYCSAENYAKIYPLIKLLVIHGQYDYLKRLFDLLSANDIPFDVNKTPVGENESLLKVAFHRLQCAINENGDTQNYEKIIKLLFESCGAHIFDFIQADLVVWVKYFISIGADLDFFDTCGFSDLYKKSKSIKMLQCLISLKVPSFCTGSRYEALAQAVEKSDIVGVARAIRSGATGPYLFNAAGQNLLSVAAKNNQVKIAENLLLNAQQTLDFLVQNDDYETLQFIFSNGLFCLNKNQRSSLMRHAGENKKMIDLLNKFDATMSEEEKKADDLEIHMMTVCPQLGRLKAQPVQNSGLDVWSLGASVLDLLNVKDRGSILSSSSSSSQQSEQNASFSILSEAIAEKKRSRLAQAARSSESQSVPHKRKDFDDEKEQEESPRPLKRERTLVDGSFDQNTHATQAACAQTSASSSSVGASVAPAVRTAQVNHTSAAPADFNPRAWLMAVNVDTIKPWKFSRI